MSFTFWRRAALASALAGVFTAAVMAPAANAQIPPDVLVVGQVAEPATMDPHVATAVNDFRILVNIYEGLVRYSPGTLEVEPALAESWEISEDGTVYTFQLRDGVAFHDGTPFDAEAVDEAVDHPDQRIGRHQLVQPLGKQRRLLPLDTLDIARHHHLRWKLTGVSESHPEAHGNQEQILIRALLLPGYPGFHTA